MTYIFYTLLSWVFSGCISIYFRTIEIKKEVILMPKHLFIQIGVFILFAYIFWRYFTQITIDLWFINLSWMLIYIIFSSASYYAVQVFYEYYSGNTLFATESEVKKYLEKLESER